MITSYGRGGRYALFADGYGAVFLYVQLLRLADGNGAVFLSGKTLCQPRVPQRPLLPDLRLRNRADFDFPAAGEGRHRQAVGGGSGDFRRGGVSGIGGGILHLLADGKAVPRPVVGLLPFPLQFERPDLPADLPGLGWAGDGLRLPHPALVRGAGGVAVRPPR